MPVYKRNGERTAIFWIDRVLGDGADAGGPPWGETQREPFVGAETGPHMPSSED